MLESERPEEDGSIADLLRRFYNPFLPDQRDVARQITSGLQREGTHSAGAFRAFHQAVHPSGSAGAELWDCRAALLADERVSLSPRLIPTVPDDIRNRAQLTVHNVGIAPAQDVRIVIDPRVLGPDGESRIWRESHFLLDAAATVQGHNWSNDLPPRLELRSTGMGRISGELTAGTGKWKPDPPVQVRVAQAIVEHAGRGEAQRETLIGYLEQGIENRLLVEVKNLSSVLRNVRVRLGDDDQSPSRYAVIDREDVIPILMEMAFVHVAVEPMQPERLKLKFMVQDWPVACECPCRGRQLLNPYQVGQPIHPGSVVSIERESVHDFVRENVRGDQGQYNIVLFGQMRTGKSTVLRQLELVLRPTYRLVNTTLQSVGDRCRNLADYLQWLAEQIHNSLPPEVGARVAAPAAMQFGDNPTGMFSQFIFEATQQLGGTGLILAIDEFDKTERLIASRTDREALYGFLRELPNRTSSFSCIFVGAVDLQRMMQDKTFTLFNQAHSLRISFLSPESASSLIRKPMASTIHYDDNAVETILQMTAGHPYLVQAICKDVVDEINRAARRRKVHIHPPVHVTDQFARDIMTAGEFGETSALWNAVTNTMFWPASDKEEQLALQALAYFATGPGDEVRSASVCPDLCRRQ